MNDMENDLDYQYPRGFSERFKQTVSWADTLWTILGWFGWKALVISVGLAAGSWILGYVRNEPVVTLSMSATSLFIALAFACKMPAISGLLSARPKLAVWRHIDPLTLWQAAHLFEGINPPSTVTGLFLRPEAEGYCLMLLQAIKAGELQTIAVLPSGADSTINPQLGINTCVSRESLEKFAHKRGFKPGFLRHSPRHLSAP